MIHHIQRAHLLSIAMPSLHPIILVFLVGVESSGPWVRAVYICYFGMSKCWQEWVMCTACPLDGITGWKC